MGVGRAELGKNNCLGKTKSGKDLVIFPPIRYVMTGEYRPMCSDGTDFLGWQ